MAQTLRPISFDQSTYTQRDLLPCKILLLIPMSFYLSIHMLLYTKISHFILVMQHRRIMLCIYWKFTHSNAVCLYSVGIFLCSCVYFVYSLFYMYNCFLHQLICCVYLTQLNCRVHLVNGLMWWRRREQFMRRSLIWCISSVLAKVWKR